MNQSDQKSQNLDQKIDSKKSQDLLFAITKQIKSEFVKTISEMIKKDYLVESFPLFPGAYIVPYPTTLTFAMVSQNNNQIKLNVITVGDSPAFCVVDGKKSANRYKKGLWIDYDGSAGLPEHF